MAHPRKVQPLDEICPFSSNTSESRHVKYRWIPETNSKENRRKALSIFAVAYVQELGKR